MAEESAPVSAAPEIGSGVSCVNSLAIDTTSPTEAEGIVCHQSVPLVVCHAALATTSPALASTPTELATALWVNETVVLAETVSTALSVVLASWRSLSAFVWIAFPIMNEDWILNHI